MITKINTHHADATNKHAQEKRLLKPYCMHGCTEERREGYKLVIFFWFFFCFKAEGTSPLDRYAGPFMHISIQYFCSSWIITKRIMVELL